MGASLRGGLKRIVSPALDLLSKASWTCDGFALPFFALPRTRAVALERMWWPPQQADTERRICGPTKDQVADSPACMDQPDQSSLSDDQFLSFREHAIPAWRSMTTAEIVLQKRQQTRHFGFISPRARGTCPRLPYDSYIRALIPGWHGLSTGVCDSETEQRVRVDKGAGRDTYIGKRHKVNKASEYTRPFRKFYGRN